MSVTPVCFWRWVFSLRVKDIFLLLHVPGDCWLGTGYCEVYIAGRVFCCVPIKNVGLHSGMQFSYLGSVWSCWGLLSHFFFYESRSRAVLKSRANFCSLLRTLYNVLCIIRSFYFGWWEHELFSALDECQELFGSINPDTHHLLF